VRLFGIGCLTFVASQVLHVPFNIWVLNPIIQALGMDIQTAQGLELILLAFLYGLSAGLFEEISRYTVFSFWLTDQNKRTWKSALMFGAGHGGTESILLAVGVIQMIAMHYVGISDKSVQKAVAEYWALPWYAVLLAAVERVFAITAHLALTILVLQSVQRGNKLWLVAAIAWHTCVDAIAVFAVQTWGIYVTELLICLFALVSLGMVFHFRESDSDVEGEAPLEAEYAALPSEDGEPDENDGEEVEAPLPEREEPLEDQQID